MINDQSAEEAFTFYDHPKVLIFKKSADFDAAQVQSILSTVDLTKVVRLTPRQFDDYSNLLLPADRLASNARAAHGLNYSATIGSRIVIPFWGW